MRLNRIALFVPALGLAGAALIGLAGHATRAEGMPDCRPAGETGALTEAWMPIAHGESVDFLCRASAGQTYRFDLNYQAGPQLPGDAGSYLAIESYRLNHTATAWAERSSEANGFARETVARTADVDEDWLIRVTNTATSGAYDTRFMLSSVILTGSD
ncbi:MAG: hypothetical protein H6648_01650 [Caldilineae bacterium]|nr:hypothetical protein [Chloroflexota bacterium]MCB9175835.1 hypothetical protein [Caldilineae bacterium]